MSTVCVSSTHKWPGFSEIKRMLAASGPRGLRAANAYPARWPTVPDPTTARALQVREFRRVLREADGSFDALPSKTARKFPLYSADGPFAGVLTQLFEVFIAGADEVHETHVLHVQSSDRTVFAPLDRALLRYLHCVTIKDTGSATELAGCLYLRSLVQSAQWFSSREMRRARLRGSPATHAFGNLPLR